MKKRMERDLLILSNTKGCFNLFKCTIYIPSIFKFYCLQFKESKKFFLKIYSTIYYVNFALILKELYLSFDQYTNNVTVSGHGLTSGFFSWIKWLTGVLSLFTSFFFKKIKFRGKGYYLYKNYRNTITPQFGYSHRIYFYSYFVKGVFLTKTKVLFFGFNKLDVLQIPFRIRSKRYINVFTGRGVRFSDQVIYKKTGKVSLYR